MLRQSTTRNSTFKETKTGWFSETMLKADIFHQDIEILFENGKPKLQTHCGVVMGLIMISIIFSYTYMKATVMFEYLDNTIQEPTRQNYFGPNFEYDGRDGWRVAFGITGYGSEIDNSPLDESIGTLGAY